MRLIGILALSFGLGATASAQLFDVTSINFVAGTAEGTSNGIHFNFSGSLWNVRTYIDNSYTGFSTGNFTPPMATSDVLHTGDPFNMVFDQVIDSALVYLADDPDGNYNNWWNFGVTATVVSGAVDVSGTSFRLTAPQGGIVRLSGISSNELHSPSIGDGNDFAIVVESVPEPASLVLMAAGVAAVFRRKR